MKFQNHVVCHKIQFLVHCCFYSISARAVDSELLLHANNSCLFFQHKDIKMIEKHLNWGFPTLLDWFVDNKLRVHFGEDKTKSILFPLKIRCNRPNRYLSQGLQDKTILKGNLSWMCLGWMPNRETYGTASVHKNYLKTM